MESWGKKVSEYKMQITSEIFCLQKGYPQSLLSQVAEVNKGCLNLVVRPSRLIPTLGVPEMLAGSTV